MAAFLAVALIACAGGAGSHRAQREALAAEANELARALAAAPDSSAAGALRVRLAFGAAADLDVYLTDPNHETAYFANTPTKLGAQLARDVLCDAPAPRIETITLEDPIPGRYRVGVDYPQACGDDRGPVSFVVYFDTNGRRESRRGSIKPGEFLGIVMEADVE
ncbi:MAG: hypothetical protein VCE43_14535 [Myxococcota bacterium]|jgi:uncharacterized protein YfaP (DUF2135 family)